MTVRIRYCGHDAVFTADLLFIDTVVVIRHDGPLLLDTIQRPATDAAYHMSDFPNPGFWRPDIGVFVIPVNQLRSLLP
jgi:hypothetical protein